MHRDRDFPGISRCPEIGSFPEPGGAYPAGSGTGIGILRITGPLDFLCLTQPRFGEGAGVPPGFSRRPPPSEKFQRRRCRFFLF